METTTQTPVFSASSAGAEKQEKLCAVYDAYKKGTVTKKEYALALISACDAYIKYVIKTSHMVAHAEFNDLYNNAVLCILERIDLYDPHRAMISTFFKYPIWDAIRDPGCSKNTVSLTAEFGTARAKLQACAEKLGYEKDDDGLKRMVSCESAGLLSTLTGLETRQITNVISRLGLCSIASIDAIGEATSDTFDTPEEACEKKEMEENVHIAISRLTPFETFLIMYDAAPDSEDKPTIRTLVGQLLDENNSVHKEYEDEIPKDLTSVKLQQKIAEVKRKLSRMPEIRKAASGRYTPNVVDYGYEQADVDDISRTIRIEFPEDLD